jgi:hypothetical protein
MPIFILAQRWGKQMNEDEDIGLQKDGPIVSYHRSAKDSERIRQLETENAALRARVGRLEVIVSIARAVNSTSQAKEYHQHYHSLFVSNISEIDNMSLAYEMSRLDQALTVLDEIERRAKALEAEGAGE